MAPRSRVVLIVLYSLCVLVTSLWSIHRYRNFASGWAWDLAHVNQSFWCVANGVPEITVRPNNHYGREGPEPWRSVHLAVLRAAMLLPIYWICPRPETLLVLHGTVFWLSLFGVAALARSACPPGANADRVALFAAVLWAVTPVSSLMALNDCRPLQMGLPFLLWAILGYVRRQIWLLAVTGLAACLSRQEYGLAIAALAILPADRTESVAQRWTWRLAVALCGILWFAGYFAYIDLLFGWEAVHRYFHVPTPFARRGLWDNAWGFVETSAGLGVLLGGWSVLALRQWRFLVAAVPFLYLLVARNLTHVLPTDEEWHFLRYMAIATAFLLAGGCRTLGMRELSTGSSRRWIVLLAIAVLWIGPASWIHVRLASIPTGIDRADEELIRRTIHRIPPDAVVWTEYGFSALVSGRRYVFPSRAPWDKAAVQLIEGHEHWVLLNVAYPDDARLELQAFDQLGFVSVDQGSRFHVLHRPAQGR